MPTLLKAAGISVERHADHFPANTPDVVWIASVGERGWFVITLDKSMGRKPLERAAIAKVTVGVFMLGGHLPAFELGENFVNTYRRVESFIKRHPRPFIAKVSRPTGGVHSGRPGEVRMWKSKTDLP